MPLVTTNKILSKFICISRIYIFCNILSWGNPNFFFKYNILKNYNWLSLHNTLIYLLWIFKKGIYGRRWNCKVISCVGKDVCLLLIVKVPLDKSIRILRSLGTRLKSIIMVSYS